MWKCHVNTQREDGYGRDWNYAQVKEFPGLLEAGKDKEEFSLETSKRMWVCQHLDFRCLASRTVRQFLCFKPLSLWYFFMATRGNQQVPSGLSLVSALFISYPWETYQYLPTLLSGSWNQVDWFCYRIFSDFKRALRALTKQTLYFSSLAFILFFCWQ